MKLLKWMVAVALFAAATGGAYAQSSMAEMLGVGMSNASAGDDSGNKVGLINRAIYCTDETLIKNIGTKHSGIEFSLKGLYAHGEMMYLHMQIRNTTRQIFYIDYVRIKAVDEQSAKRDDSPAAFIYPQRYFNGISMVRPRGAERSVWAIEKEAILEGAALVVELFEKDHEGCLNFTVGSDALKRAQPTDKLRLR